MSRVRAHLTPSRLGAAFLVIVAVLDLGAGLGLLPHRASTATRRAERPRAPAAPRDTRAVRVVAPRVHVRRGDRVDLLVTLDPERYPDVEPTRGVGEGFMVMAVDHDGADPDATGVTLAVPRALVPRVAFAATSGAITLAVVPERRRA